MARERVVVAMSGGVDSSVAAALLVEAGYEVIGVTMQIWPEGKEDAAHTQGCCSLGAVDDARAVADALGIPYYVLNMRERFQSGVIDYFKDAYLRGLTPNPCIACNRQVKFDALLRKAQALGATRLATGHYARITTSPDGACHLRRAADRAKDQSYVLFGLTQAELRHVMFPCGEFTKPEIRERARKLGLITADKPDSQEICFVTRDYRDLIQDAPQRRGHFVTPQGDALGDAPGVAHFTVGQRKGLSFPHQEPLFVLALDPESGDVVVGTEDDLYEDAFRVRDVTFLQGEPDTPFEAEVMVRSHAAPGPAHVIPDGHGGAEVRLTKPQRALSPGQACVFYDGDEVLGGGIIARARSVAGRFREAVSK